MARPLRIFISAGEESGDRHGADIAAALRALEPTVEIRGVGGPRMAAAGCALLFDVTDMAVMWFVDVFRNLRVFVRLFERTVRALGAWRPDVVVPIDYPGFNLRLADRARGMDIPVAYFVSPQVWAWFPGRVQRVAEVVDRMIVIFPFEEAFYREEGVRARWVGHPVCDRLAGVAPDPARLAEAGLPPDAPAVGLFPGSRRSEVRRNLPVMLETAALLARAPGAPPPAFLAAFSRPAPAALARSIAERGPVPLAVLEGDVHAAMASCRAALVCAGSATVELAFLGVPMVVLYQVAWPSYLLYLLLNRSPHVAMANLLAGRRAVPEFVSWRRSGAPLAAALQPLIDEGPRRDAQIEALADVRRALGGPGAARRAAALILQTAREGRPPECP